MADSHVSSWRKKFRSVANGIWLNPVLTRFYDWLAPPGSLGQRGERIAERLLLKQGMFIVDRGYQEKFGEVDLIAIDVRTVVFVEVKTRSSDFAGVPLEAVDDQKQAKISRVASAYLKRHGLLDCQCRFDVVAIEMGQSGQQAHIRHIENAFESVD